MTTTGSHRMLPSLLPLSATNSKLEVLGLKMQRKPRSLSLYIKLEVQLPEVEGGHREDS
jgi:hypothetical protein